MYNLSMWLLMLIFSAFTCYSRRISHLVYIFISNPGYPFLKYKTLNVYHVILVVWYFNFVKFLMVQTVCQKWVGDEIIFSVIKKFNLFVVQKAVLWKLSLCVV